MTIQSFSPTPVPNRLSSSDITLRGLGVKLFSIRYILPTINCYHTFLGFILLFASGLFAEEQPKLALRFREQPTSEGNLVRLGDIAEINGDQELVKQFAQIPLIPSPPPGVDYRWRKDDVLQHLRLRGIDVDQLRWLGTTETILKAPAEMVDIPATNSKMAPAFADARTTKQAKQNLTDAINRYISLQTPGATPLKVEFELPMAHVNTLFQRKNIKALGGGNTPWLGQQQFTVRLQEKDKIIDILVDAQISPPESYVVSVSALRKGQVLQASDLTTEVIPQNINATNTDTAEDPQYILDPQQIIGKQLRRAIGKGLPIRAIDVGEPIVVTRNQIVQIQVISGGITVETMGRAMTDGAIGDLIQVESVALPNKKKLQAVIKDANTVQVVANSTGAFTR
jgi:flagella basal body P-ring formation protein FlgA